MPSYYTFNNSDHFIEDPQPIWTTGRRVAWKEQLLRVLCRYCGCAINVTKQDNIFRFTIAGRVSNVASMRKLWELLVDHIHSQAELVVDGRVPIGSFCAGFVDGLNKQIDNNPALDRNEDADAARRWLHISRYGMLELPKCNNAYIEHWSFQQGQSKAKMFSLCSRI